MRGEPTFSAELRQVGDGLLVRRPQWPLSPASRFQVVSSPEHRRASVGRVGALVSWERSVGRERCRPKVSGTEDSVRDSKVMMNSPVLERMKGRYRKGILELTQAGDAGRSGENFG